MRMLVLALVGAVVGCGTAHAQIAEYTKCLIATKTEVTDEEGTDRCLTLIGVPNPGEEVRLARHAEWRKCLAPKITSLDDGVSPAIDIARVVARMCGAEWVAYSNSLWLVKETKRKMAEGVSTYGAQDAEVGVLRARSIKP